MITKRFILQKPFNFEKDFSKEEIFSKCNTSDEKAETISLLVDAEKKGCEIKMTTNKSEDLVVISFESKSSDILGTNTYITSSLVTTAIPKLAKTIYVNSRMFILAYYNDPMVETIVQELQRLILFIIGNEIGSRDVLRWKDLIKSFVESNIRYCDVEGENVCNGEKFVYITKSDLFCNPSEFDED